MINKRKKGKKKEKKICVRKKKSVLYKFVYDN